MKFCSCDNDVGPGKADCRHCGYSFNLNKPHVITVKSLLALTIMSEWVTPQHLEILTKHKAAYDEASSELARMAVLKLITHSLREHGKKGLPKKLGKVWKACSYLYISQIPIGGT